MAELIVIRHGQASFGADDYDVLSDLGARQSEAVGTLLKEADWSPDRMITGTLMRQKDTLRAMGFRGAPEEHAGFNEYDFNDLLNARFQGDVPDLVKHDRKAHFRTLRETILDWQQGGCIGARETYAEFASRVEAARQFACGIEVKRVLVVSSGGPIGQLTARALGAPDPQMMALNLQMKNTSITRFVFSGQRFFLHEFNSTPHLLPKGAADMLTYS